MYWNGVIVSFPAYKGEEDYMEVHIYLIPIYYLGQSARTVALCDTLDTLWDLQVEFESSLIRFQVSRRVQFLAEL